MRNEDEEKAHILVDQISNVRKGGSDGGEVVREGGTDGARKGGSEGGRAGGMGARRHRQGGQLHPFSLGEGGILAGVRGFFK